MGFMPDQQTEEFRAVVRDFLAKESSEARVRELMGTSPGYDRAVWTRAAELGLPGLAVPEEYGGSGAGLIELGVIFEEMGRALFCGPFLATAGLAATTILAVADEDGRQDLLPALCAGERIATVAWSGPSAAGSTLTVDGSAISGRAGYVVDGSVADLILVAADDGSGHTTVLSVAADAPGLRRTELTTMDSTRTLAALDFDRVHGTVVCDDAGAGLIRTTHIAGLLLAAEQLGGAQQALDTAVQYAKDRVQFGRAIGSFQTIKHRCADMLVDVELARSVVYHGLQVAVDDAAGPEELAIASLLASSFCSDMFVRVAAANLQIHGGIGFTWEHSAHLYLKRAKSSSLLFGSATGQRRELAAALGLVEAK